MGNYLLPNKLYCLDIFLHKLPTMTLDFIKLSSYDTFPLFVSQMG